MINFRLFATAALLGVSTLVIAAPASAAPCHDAKGHFAKCNGTNGPVAARKTAPIRTIAHAAAPAPARTAAVVHPASTVAAKPATKVAAMTAAKPAPKAVKPAAKPATVAAAAHAVKPAAKTTKTPKVG
jgi:large subunit ribosomal protein L22e